MKERILQIMSQEGLNSSRFAEEIGIQRAAISHITSGRNNPSMEIVKKILERYTHVNPDWLIFGTGAMNREKQLSGSPIQQDLFSNAAYISPEKKNIPEYRPEIRDKNTSLPAKKPANENIAAKETPTRKVAKIVIFYSDQTYETFIAERT